MGVATENTTKGVAAHRAPTFPTTEGKGRRQDDVARPADAGRERVFRYPRAAAGEPCNFGGQDSPDAYYRLSLGSSTAELCPDTGHMLVST